jgi:formyl-CoA transferase/CoA:oxalate CoA-transferase
MRALDDVTVLDLSHALAGPFASTMLADYGADVIKIETPGAGDMARVWGPPFYEGQRAESQGQRAEGTGQREAAYFVNLHRNKKSVAIDLKHPDGKSLFFRLLEGADVVLENLRVGAVQRLGIDYARARERNPRII